MMHETCEKCGLRVDWCKCRGKGRNPKANIRHSSSEARWGTGDEIVAIAKRTLGAFLTIEHPASDLPPIHVDPFSESRFNDREGGVGARRILTGAKDLDGYRDRWIDDERCPRADWVLAGLDVTRSRTYRATEATALVNPPGSDDGESVKNAWRLVDAYHRLLWVDSAIWVAFNMNQLQTLQGISPRSPFHGDFDGCRCVPERRIPFVHHDPAHGVEAPSHPCWFMLLPSSDAALAGEQRRLFESMASKLGEVW